MFQVAFQSRLLDKHSTFLNPRTVQIYRKRVSGWWLWIDNHRCTYEYRSARGKRPKAFTAPCAYQASSRLAEYYIVRNDTAHVERSHNILVPYYHMVENSTLANAGELHGPRHRLIFKVTVGVIITAMGALSMTNHKQFGLPRRSWQSSWNGCEYCNELSSLRKMSAHNNSVLFSTVAVTECNTSKWS